MAKNNHKTLIYCELKSNSNIFRVLFFILFVFFGLPKYFSQNNFTNNNNNLSYKEIEEKN